MFNVYYGEIYWDYNAKRIDSWRKLVRGFVGKCGYLPHAVRHRFAAKVKARIPKRLAEYIRAMAADLTRQNIYFGVENFLVTASALCRRFLATRYTIWAYPPPIPEEFSDCETVDEFRLRLRHCLVDVTLWTDARRKKQPNAEPEGYETVEFYFYTTPQFKKKICALAKQLKVSVGELLAFCATFKASLRDIEDLVQEKFKLKYPCKNAKPYLEFLPMLARGDFANLSARATLTEDEYYSGSVDVDKHSEGKAFWLRAIEKAYAELEREKTQKDIEASARAAITAMATKSVTSTATASAHTSSASGIGSIGGSNSGGDGGRGGNRGDNERGDSGRGSSNRDNSNGGENNGEHINPPSGAHQYNIFKFIFVRSSTDYDVLTYEEAAQRIREQQEMEKRLGKPIHRDPTYLSKYLEMTQFIFRHYHLFSARPVARIEQCPFCGQDLHADKMILPPNATFCARCLVIFTCEKTTGTEPATIQAVTNFFNPLYIPQYRESERDVGVADSAQQPFNNAFTFIPMEVTEEDIKREQEFRQLIEEVLNEDLFPEDLDERIEKVKQAARTLNSRALLPCIVYEPTYISIVMHDVLMRAGMSEYANEFLSLLLTDYTDRVGDVIGSALMADKGHDVDFRIYIPYVIGELVRSHPRGEELIKQNLQLLALMLGIPYELHYAKFRQLKDAFYAALSEVKKELPPQFAFNITPLDDANHEVAIGLVEYDENGEFVDIICIPAKLHFPVFVELKGCNDGKLWLPYEMLDVHFHKEYQPSYVAVGKIDDIIDVVVRAAKDALNAALQSRKR